MELNFYKPISEILQKHIKGYYFISENRNSDQIKYWTFPNNYCILSASQNINIKIKNNLFIIKLSPKKNIVTHLVSSYVKPIQFNYKQLTNEVTIYFKPLGINYFIEETNGLFKEKINSNFTFLPDYNDKVLEIFKLNRENQISELENYLLSKLLNKDFNLIEKILEDIGNDLKIKDIAEKHNLTRQYINKIFVRYIGKSLSEFRKIDRFRNSIIKQKDSKSYTELSYNVGFYDQSHFIRNFRELSNHNPNSFFKNVDVTKENLWFFV